jgi:8-oxo-dGTP pyrophosphatase MutT (NUDIX family)
LETGEGHPPDAAVAVIMDPLRLGTSLLLIRRSERIGDPWSGQIAFPGGYKVTGDRTFLETAIREANEEVGIPLEQHTVLGVLPLVYARTRRVSVAPFVFLLRNNVQVHRSLEVADAFWVPVSELADSAVISSEVEVEEGKLTVDSYSYRGNVIWGLTFRIISILLGKTSESTD